MRIAISFLALFSLFLIGSSIAQQNQIVASASVRMDPILVTARYVALLQDYQDTLEWHNRFARQFADTSGYKTKEVDLVADVFQTSGEISKIGVREVDDSSGTISVEVMFKRAGAPKVDRGLEVPLSSAVFTLAADKSSKIVSISVDGSWLASSVSSHRTLSVAGH